MTYSKYFYPQQSRIPVPLTIVFLAVLIFFLARLFAGSAVPSKAGKKKLSELKLVNPARNQMGIFWKTEAREKGWVVYGESKNYLNGLASDERDLQDRKNEYFSHFALIKNLQPDKQYYYKIVSGNELIEADGGNPFSFRTPSDQQSGGSPNPAYGKVIRENGQPLENAFVFITLDRSFPMVAISKATGEWLMPLNNVILQDTLKNISVSSEARVKIEIFNDDGLRSNIITSTEKISPLPQTAIIGKDYDFMKEEEVLSASSVKSGAEGELSILFPRESAVIPAGKPLIKGTALPGSEILAEIDSRGYPLKTKTDADGIWQIITNQLLAPGTHTLKITAGGSSGKSVSLTRKFTIAKSGEQVLSAATPEATLTSLPTPTEEPIVLLSPTIYEEPETTPTPYTFPSASPPTSGNNIFPAGIASASLILLGLGILLVF